LNWKKIDKFSDLLSVIRNRSSPNIMAISALSVTEERQKYARFSDVYLPDITVLVSSKGTPVVQSFEEINQMMSNMDAVTIRDTKYEKKLQDIKDQFNADFNIMYLDAEVSILDVILEADDRFGFIDLPVYLILLKNGGDLTRQNFFTVRGKGYGFMLPLASDWDEPMNEFLNHPDYEKEIKGIISKYLGEELYLFIENIYANEQIGTSILSVEKELQLALIENTNLRLEEEQSIRMVLTTGIATVGLFLMVIGYLFFKNQRTTKILMGQKDQIFDQQEDIREKNQSLMNRNAQLISLNEEKNNLVKILAHDIRSPLSQIIMVTEILNNPSEEAVEKQGELLTQVGLSAHRINEMVTKILDLDSLDEEHVKVRRERVDINDILSDIRNRYKDTAKKKKIKLRVDQCKENNIIRTDHLLLTLVLENLVSNALKFSLKNTAVRLEADCKYDGVLFKVSDEGPGFTESDKKLAFNRFQKLSAKPTAGESSIGLGLSIVKKYVDDMDGEVWLESEAGNGATFFVKLSV
ncbi:MAG: ATP-binding protein, partial [Bacteroidota bacterium]